MDHNHNQVDEDSETEIQVKAIAHKSDQPDQKAAKQRPNDRRPASVWSSHTLLCLSLLFLFAKPNPSLHFHSDAPDAFDQVQEKTANFSSIRVALNRAQPMRRL